MTTANTIVSSAYRRINVAASDESISSADSADLLEILNDYLSELGGRGASYTHYTLALADTVQLPTELDGALKAVLAFRGSEFFGQPIRPGMEDAAMRGDNLILGTMMVPVDLGVEDGVRDPLTSARYNINLG